jgi:hypothetical protein
MDINSIVCLAGILGYSALLWHTYHTTAAPSYAGVLLGAWIIPTFSLEIEGYTVAERGALFLVWSLELLCLVMWHPLHSWLLSLVALVVGYTLSRNKKTIIHKYTVRVACLSITITTTAILVIAAVVTGIFYMFGRLLER